MQNEPVLQYFQNAVSETVEDEDISLLPECEDEECEEDASEVEADNQENLETDLEEEQLSDEGGDVPKGRDRAKSSRKSDPRKSPVFSDEDSDLDFDIGKLEQQTKMQIKPPGKPREKSVVDDKFFKLSEMESFLEKVEKEEEKDQMVKRRTRKTLTFLKTLIQMKAREGCLGGRRLSQIKVAEI